RVEVAVAPQPDESGRRGAILELAEYHAVQLLESFRKIRVEVAHEPVAPAGCDVVTAQFDDRVTGRVGDACRCGARIDIRACGGNGCGHADDSNQQGDEAGHGDLRGSPSHTLDQNQDVSCPD